MINGINTVGIKVLANSTATNADNIYVNNGLDAATNLANYGIQAIGTGAVANLSGLVALNGDGAISVVAEDRGTINITGNGQVAFGTGKKQVGYLIYGAGRSSHSPQFRLRENSTYEHTAFSGGLPTASLPGK